MPRTSTAAGSLLVGPLVLVLATGSLAHAQDATSAGAVTAPNPTLEHISLEWAFSGDDDADSVVQVRFREEGGAFRAGLDLMRVPGGSNEGFSWATRHAGSLFGLRPGTAYEIELTLSDPDGGDAVETLTVTTRPVPAVADDAPTTEATPATIDAVLGAASAGDVVLLMPGTYGSITVPSSGADGAPIVVRGSDVETVIVEGEVRMDGRSHVWVEALDVRDQIKFNNSDHIVVRGCRVRAQSSTGDGIVSYGQGTTDSYVADNVVTGQTVWSEAAFGVSGDNLGEGIALTGAGNVIEHNRVSGFRDCISLLEDGGAVDQFSIDILRNDLDVCADDAIEADFAMGNVRVIANRMVNSFIALSSQPSLGGPTWFIRNVSFNNVFQVFKPNRGSVGDVWFHNTVVKPGDAMGVYAGREWSRATFRNNLLIGGTGGGTYGGFDNGSGRVLQVADADEASCDFDYDGFGSIGTGTFAGRLGGTSFSSLAELTSTTSEVHAVEVDLAVFAATFPFPDTPLVAASVPDLQLAEGGAAIDRGAPLANVNDGFSGAAPDLGAFERGAPVPAYGPRGLAECGNSRLELGEDCDDGNTADGDGCSAGCRIEPGADAGPRQDAGPGARLDGGSSDGGGAARDGAPGATDGGPGASDGGCGCRAVGVARRGSAPLFAVLFGLFAARRRRRGLPSAAAVPSPR